MLHDPSRTRSNLVSLEFPFTDLCIRAAPIARALLAAPHGLLGDFPEPSCVEDGLSTRSSQARMTHFYPPPQIPLSCFFDMAPEEMYPPPPQVICVGSERVEWDSS